MFQEMKYITSFKSNNESVFLHISKQQNFWLSANSTGSHLLIFFPFQSEQSWSSLMIIAGFLHFEYYPVHSKTQQLSFTLRSLAVSFAKCQIDLGQWTT